MGLSSCLRRALKSSFTLIVFSLLFRTGLAQSAVPASFVFGDSLVDAGNNNYIGSLATANHPANGIDFEGGVATGRFTNGRTVPDIVGQLLGLPFAPAYLDPTTKGPAILKGVNFASGGAGILDFTGYNFIHRIPMGRQVANFANTSQEIFQLLGPTAGAELIGKALFSVTMGSNDYLNNWLVVGSPSPKEYTPQQFQDMIISNYRRYMQQLVALGARKFVLANVGPLGCTPYRLTFALKQGGQCVASDNLLVKNFNVALAGMVDELNANFPHARFIVANAYNVVSSLINNPATYGLNSVDSACCGLLIGPYRGVLPCFQGVPHCSDRKGHLFWDPYHPTDSANIVLGNRFYSGGPTYAYPMNIRALAALSLS